jgi:hypothetical protein
MAFHHGRISAVRGGESLVCVNSVVFVIGEIVEFEVVGVVQALVLEVARGQALGLAAVEEAVEEGERGA